MLDMKNAYRRLHAARKQDSKNLTAIYNMVLEASLIKLNLQPTYAKKHSVYRALYWLSWLNVIDILID